LDVLYEGLGISKLQFLVIKTLDPVSLEMLDLDPEKMVLQNITFLAALSLSSV
jgi:hypothetical protein